MDFRLTTEQRALQDNVRRFVEREYDFEARNALLRGERFSRTHWATFAELGWLGAGLTEDEGGYGGGPIENALILEELGRAMVLEPFLACAVVAIQAIVAQADTDQRAPLLESIIAGETLAVLAHGEANGRGVSTHVETRATRSGDDYVLSGRKSFVLGGPHADVVLVSARTSGAPNDEDGVSLFVVPTNTGGVTCSEYHAVDGRKVCDVALNDVTVPSSARLGDEGGAFAAIDRALDHGVIGACAEAVGAMDAALWMTRDYLKTRSQFGVTLNTFQALKHRMADMLVECELARSMLYRGLASLDATDSNERRAGVSAAKAHIGEAGYFVGSWAVQLHGAIGTTQEHPVGHLFKRLTLVRGLFGASDMHLARFSASSRRQAAAHTAVTTPK